MLNQRTDLEGEVDLVAHGSQSSQIGILLLVAIFRVNRTALVDR